MPDPYAAFSSPVAQNDPYASFSSPVQEQRDAQGNQLDPKTHIPMTEAADFPQAAQQAPATTMDRVNAGAAGVNHFLLADLLGVPANAVANALDLIGAGGATLLSKANGDNDPGSYYQPIDRANAFGTTEYIEKQLDKTPVGELTQAPRPDDAASRYAFAAGRGVGAATLGPAMGANLGPSLAANVTGSLASQGAAEAGAPPIVQLAAGMAGGVAPTVARQTLAGGTRAALRGGEAGRQRVEQNIQTFENAGTSPSMGQAAETRMGRATESFLHKVPGGAGPMARKADSQAAEIGAQVEKTAGKLAPQASGEQAGRAITQGVSGENGFVQQFKAKQTQLYDELDKHVPKDTRVDVTKTAAALKALNADIPGAPNVSEFFKNSKIKGIEGALRADIEGTSALAARSDIPEFAGAKPSTAKSSKPQNPFRQTPNKDPFGPATRDDLDLAASLLNDGKLPYEAVKKLRTLVGNELADSGPLSDVPRSKWKPLYAALSSDLEAAATNAGPNATAAFNRANNYTRAGMKRLEVIDTVVDKAGGPEKVFQAATGGAKEGATTLRAVMQSLPEDAQKTLSASVLRRMGRATSGKQNDLGDKFSTETFLTNWNAMSPQAKAVLFNRYGQSFRSDMDAIAKVASNLRDGSAVFRNPSGTGTATVQTGGAIAFAAALASGNLKTAGAIGGGIGLSNVMARAMTNAKAVKWLAKTTRASKTALPAILAQATKSDDQDIRDLAELLDKQE